MSNDKTVRGANFTCFHAGPEEGWAQSRLEPSNAPVPTVMGLEVAEPIRPLTPQEYCRRAPFQSAAASDRLGWAGLEALLYNDVSDADFERPP